MLPMSMLTSGGTYKADKFEEDADKVVAYYRDQRLHRGRVGQPELKILEDSKDTKTRWVELRIPVTEGNATRSARSISRGTRLSRPKALRPLFKFAEGDVYSEKEIRKGFEKAKEVYGSGGYMEFTGYPDLAPRDAPDPAASAAAGPPAASGAPPPEAPAPVRRSST